MDGSRDALKELFFAALDRPAGERDAFLASSTANQDLVREVRALLAAHDQAGSFLDAAALPANLVAAPTLSAGQRLGPYVVGELIGQGGMGEVYRARDTRLGRQVAIKVLTAALARDKARQQRFEEEARAASALNHPNVLTVYDVGTVSAADGSAFLVMELLEGHTLRSRLQEQPPLSREQVLDYGGQIARGLNAAHAAGIVHRDLKPENLFLTNDGRMKILDFGVAKLSRSDDFGGVATQTTQTGVVIGTVGYMAPEQVRGQPADARSDIFAFGTVLFEMLTGARAFAGDSSIDTLSAILHVDPLEQHNAATGGDPALVGIVRRCIAKEPADRYQRAAELVDALEGARRPSRRPSVPRPRVVAVAAAVVLITIVAALVWQYRRASPAASSAGSVPQQSGPERVFAVLPFESISADQSQRYIASGMTEEITARLARVSSLRLLSSAAVAQYGGVPDATRRIRDELGVSALLTGSVRMAGERARISVQLVDTGTAQTIWAQQYDQTLQDILQVQSDVASQIATALQASLSKEEQQRMIRQSTRSPAAYELYLKAWSLKSGPQRIAMLEQAVKLDPKFAVAYAGLSRTQGELGSFGDRQLYDAAFISARKAIEADPNEARAHHALATMQLRVGHLTDARLGYLRALDLSPSLPDAAWDLSVTDATLGRLDESLFWARRGFELAPNISLAYYHLAIPLSLLADAGATERLLRSGEQRFPRSARIQYSLADTEWLAGKEQAADARARRALAASPDNPELQAVVAGYAFLLNAPDAPSRVEELFKQSPEARTFALPATNRTLHAYHLLKRGETERATALFDEALSAAHKELDGGSEGSEVPAEIAAIHALRGKRAEALQWFNTAYRVGDRHFREVQARPVLCVPSHRS